MSIVMRNNKQDSTSAVSRFGRDKRVRNASAESVGRNPRPRREADGDGYPERQHAGKRASFNPNFSAGNRLRGGGEQHGRNSFPEERGERPSYGRPHRTGGHEVYAGREFRQQEGRGFDRSGGDQPEQGRKPYRGGASGYGNRNDKGRGGGVPRPAKNWVPAGVKTHQVKENYPAKMAAEMGFESFFYQ